MNATAAAVLSLLAAVILFGSRRWAALAMVGGTLYLTTGMHFTVGGFALYPMRVLSVVAIVRVLSRREFPRGGILRLDLVFVALYAYSTFVFVLRSDEGFAYQIGIAVDALLLYAVFRSLVRSFIDLEWLLGRLAILLVPYVPLVWLESLTFRNPFAAVGGVELIRAGDLWIRDGRLRAAGSFGHPSLLGTFGGVMLPLYLGMLASRVSRRWPSFIGAGACLAIVGASNSGGPLICVVVAVGGWLLWPLRREMRPIRIGTLLVLVGLAIFMKAPIWYLLARVSSLTGGDGYHRSALLDVAFQHLGQWWLAGMPFSETSHWLPYTNTNTGAVDMTNTFLSFGISSGLGAIVLLVVLLVQAYSQLGRAMSAIRTRSRKADPQEAILWGLGVALAVHMFNWFGITYWDQTSAIWFFQLALIATLTSQVLRQRSTRRLQRLPQALMRHRHPAP